MTEREREQIQRLLDAYVDGRLPDNLRARFEGLLEKSPQLRATVERQRQIDASLKRQFAPPSEKAARAMLDSAPVGDDHGGVAGPTAAPRVRRRWPLVVAAASMALAAGGAWLAWDLLTGWEPTGPPPPLTLAVVYEREVEKGFKPLWVCKDDQEFRNAFRDRLGRDLLLAAAPAGVAPCGLSYTPVITLQTMVLLARVDEKPVLVFVDRLAKDKPQCVESATGLKLFRRELGPFVLYEVTPLDEPRVMDLFYEP